MGTFEVKLRGLKTKMMFLNDQLPLNENDINFDGKLNGINYQRKVIKLHDDDWKNSF